jgi:hypothetical protein
MELRQADGFRVDFRLNRAIIAPEAPSPAQPRGKREQMTLRVACSWSIGLGIASGIAMLLMFLALTDIYHGEADVTAEWQAVRVAFPVSAAFHVVAVIAAVKGLRTTNP